MYFLYVDIRESARGRCEARHEGFDLLRWQRSLERLLTRRTRLFLHFFLLFLIIFIFPPLLYRYVSFGMEAKLSGIPFSFSWSRVAFVSSFFHYGGSIAYFLVLSLCLRYKVTSCVKNFSQICCGSSTRRSSTASTTTGSTLKVPTIGTGFSNSSLR